MICSVFVGSHTALVRALIVRGTFSCKEGHVVRSVALKNYFGDEALSLVRTTCDILVITQ